VESRWERPLTLAGPRTPAHEKWVLTTCTGNASVGPGAADYVGPALPSVRSANSKTNPTPVTSIVVTVASARNILFLTPRLSFTPARVLHNKSYVFERIHTMRFSLYEIFFCPSAIYSMQSAKNHKVPISLYDIFF